jgi:CubicO group peptidase (beta-lactamase class C family)
MIAAGFERVEDVFQQQAARQRDGGLAFAATLAGEPVVDLVAGEASPGTPWGHDTRAVVMSVAKGWAVMCVQRLFDRGLLALDTPVVDVWPEYGAAGKERTLVRHVLDHTAGVVGVPDVGSLVQWDGGGWDDLDAIAARLAGAAPAWEPGTKTGYHAVTFGWLAGELVRRVDGRTLGTFFRDEIAEPLGIDAAIGVPRAAQGDVAHVVTGGAMVDVWLLRPILAKAPVQMRDPETLLGQAFLGDGSRSIMDAVDDLMADGRFLEAEVPSSNGVSSAADLARLYAPLAGGGAVDGIRLFSPASMELFLRPGPPATDAVMSSLSDAPVLGWILRRMATTARSAGGYLANRRQAGKRPYGPNPLAVGNSGAGGQLVFADPAAHVSAAFVRSALGPSNKSQEALVKVLYQCVAASR